MKKWNERKRDERHANFVRITSTCQRYSEGIDIDSSPRMNILARYRIWLQASLTTSSLGDNRLTLRGSRDPFSSTRETAINIRGYMLRNFVYDSYNIDCVRKLKAKKRKTEGTLFNFKFYSIGYYLCYTMSFCNTIY